MLADGGLHVVLCGTGSPLADSARASACTAILGGGQFILIDIGPGSWRKADVLGMPLAKLSAVLITHFHSDHIGDLGEAATMSWGAGRTQPLDVYGPPGVEAVVGGFNQAYALDVNYRVAHHGDAVMPRAASGSVAHTVQLENPTAATVVFERNGFKVTAFAVDHAPVMPAYGYRIDYAGRSVVVTGDTKKSANIAKHAAGADILIHDSLSKTMILMGSAALDNSGQARRAKIARDITTYHATPVEAAETAAAAKVATLVLTHEVPPLTTAAMEKLFLQGVAEAFSGQVVLAHDGARFDLAAK